MKAFTKKVIEKNMSIVDIRDELLFATDGQNDKREDILLGTVQELASAIIAIQKELDFNKF